MRHSVRPVQGSGDITAGAPIVRALRAWVRRPLAQRSLLGFVVYRLRWAILALAGLSLVATVGYVVIEGYGWLDAAFMTVITLSTVGYEEVRPLDGAGQLFTMGVLVAGFATLVYAAAMLAGVLTSGDAAAHLRQSRGRRMRNALDNHIIVAGFGRVGQAVARGVHDLDRTCLVIDRDPAREVLITESGLVPMIGDGTNERVLQDAGIARAAALVAATDEDGVNLLITLTARALRPDIRIVSRINEAEWRDRMVHAGADVAQSPYRSYGMSLAASAVTPGVLDVHVLPMLGLATEEIEVTMQSPFVGQTLMEIGEQRPDVFVVGLRRDRQFHRWHDLNGAVLPGDVLVALGTPGVLRQLVANS